MSGEWTVQDWENWVSEMAAALPPEVDGDEAQETLILNWVRYAGRVLPQIRDLVMTTDGDWLPGDSFDGMAGLIQQALWDQEVTA